MIIVTFTIMQNLLIGTHSGGEDRLAERDQKDPDQPAETAQRSRYVSCDEMSLLFLHKYFM